MAKKECRKENFLQRTMRKNENGIGYRFIRGYMVGTGDAENRGCNRNGVFLDWKSIKKKSPRWRPGKRRLDVVKEDLDKMGVREQRQLVRDREKWRKIVMVAKTVSVLNSKEKKESWTRSTKRKEEMEMSTCYSMMKINCMERKSNTEVLNIAREPKTVVVINILNLLNTLYGTIYLL